MVVSKKTESKLPPLVEVSPHAQIEKVVTVNKKDPLLVDLKVTNPIVYLKAWWKRILANEGVDFRFRIRPLTAIALAAVMAGTGFGLGRLTVPEPIIKYFPLLAPSPTPDPWRDTAFSGFLRFSQITDKYYLETVDSEAISLSAPANVALGKLVGKRVFATGKYNSDSGILVVSEASDLEILPVKAVPVPTTTPTPEPSPSSAL